MYVKKLKRKCGVRGCKNTDTYAISLRKEAGNSIIACKSCLAEALKEIRAIDKKQPVKKKTAEAPPSLFFHVNAEVSKEEVDTPPVVDGDTDSKDGTSEEETKGDENAD